MSRYLAFVLLALSASHVLAAPQLPTDAATDTLGTAAGNVNTAAGNLNTAAGNANTATTTVGGVLGGVTRPSVAGRAPAELPQMPSIPDMSAVTRPTLGERSNSGVYSRTLGKRDWQYPTSTKDCLMSEIPDKSKTLPYTHDGQEYSQDCLTRLAFLVPSEDRKSCRTTGPDARGYEEECLFKKAFDDDWKFDVEKAKEDELAWRSSNPSSPSSDAWRKKFPNAISDCRIDPKSEMKSSEKEVKGGKKFSSDEESGWNSYSVVPESGEMLDDDCLSSLFISIGVVLDLKTCSAAEKDIGLDISAALKLILGGRSTTELVARQNPLGDIAALLASLLAPLLGDGAQNLATPQDLANLLSGLTPEDVVAPQELAALHERAAPEEHLSAALSVLLALKTGCLLNIILKIILKVGIEAKLVEGLLGPLGFVFRILGILLG